MKRSLLSIVVVAVLSVTVVGCEPRKPSADVIEAVSRKQYDPAEVQQFVESDPTIIDDTNEFDQRPLQIAAAHGRTRAVAVLLDHGSDLEAVDHNGRTALHSACHEGEYDVARQLIARNANVNASDNNGNTPLHDVVEWSPEQIELVRLLIQSGCEPGSQNKDGETPLDIARRQKTQYLTTSYRDERFRTSRIEHYEAIQQVLDGAMKNDGP